MINSKKGQIGKTEGLGVLLGFIAALMVFLTSLVGFGITGDIAYYIYAVEDDAVWTDSMKYYNVSGDTTNTYGVDDANIKDIYEAALDNRVDQLDNLKKTIAGANLVISLISLVIVVGLFFRKGGILDILRGTKVSN